MVKVMNVLKLVTVLVTLVAATPVAAHEKGGDRAMGVVESVTPDRLVVKTADGHPVAFAVTPQTRFVRGDEAVRAEDVKRGQRAVVYGRRAGDALEAIEVKLGAANARGR